MASENAFQLFGVKLACCTEPAGSVSVAALRYLVKAAPVFENPGLTVCNLTGHGLNVPQVATDESETPGVIPPTVEAVEAFLQS